jgi:hypothetical protein
MKAAVSSASFCSGTTVRQVAGAGLAASSETTFRFGAPSSVRSSRRDPRLPIGENSAPSRSTIGLTGAVIAGAMGSPRSAA